MKNFSIEGLPQTRPSWMEADQTAVLGPQSTVWLLYSPGLSRFQQSSLADLQPVFGSHLGRYFCTNWDAVPQPTNFSCPEMTTESVQEFYWISSSLESLVLHFSSKWLKWKGQKDFAKFSEKKPFFPLQLSEKMYRSGQNNKLLACCSLP